MHRNCFLTNSKHKTYTYYNTQDVNCRFISKIKATCFSIFLLFTSTGVADFFVPMVLLVAGGGSHTLKSVIKCLSTMPITPVILIKDSGKAADILEFALSSPSRDE